MTVQKLPLEILRQFPFFQGLDATVLDELLAMSRARRLAKGEELFSEGEACRGLFFVVSGVVKIYKLAENGREQILHLQHPGDSIAELPVFDNGLYPASAAAMEEAEILFIPKASFDAVLARHPQLCRSIIQVLGKRLRKMVELVENLSLRQVRQRLARLLWEEAAGRRSFHLTNTNDELAARLGSVRDVISRTLGALQADRVVHLTGRRVEILDARRLAEEAGE